MHDARATVRRRRYEHYAVESSSSRDPCTCLQKFGEASLEVWSMRISHVGTDEDELLQICCVRGLRPPFGPPLFPD